MTDRWLVFNSLFPVTWVIVAGVIVTVIAVVLEWKKNSRFRFLRLFAQVIVVFSIVVLILRPAVKREYDGNQTILLTENFARPQVDSLLARLPKAQLARTAKVSPYRNAQLITALNDLNGVIYVVGDGLTPGELDEIPEKQFTHLSSSSPKGIISVVSEEARVNQLTNIHVRVSGEANEKVLIKSPGKIEDSVSITKNDYSTLKIRPKQAGQFLFSILTKDKNGSIVEEQPLALEVLPEQKLRILILQEFPTAEVRYLKNFLADRGHSITLRYQLSRNIFRHEFANSDQKKINRVDNETLSAFDLAVVDSDVLKKLSAAERKQLSNSLRQGLGVLVLFNESPQQTKSADDLPGISFVATKTDTAYLSITSGATTMVKTLGATAQPNESFVPLLQTSDRKVLSGYRYHGLGKVGINLVTETYRFLIEGHENTYASIWSPLLTSLSRKKQENFSVKILTPQPIYPNEPVAVEILSASGKPSLLAEDTAIPLTEDVLIDNRWLGKTWFDEPGWHTLTIPEDSTRVNVYIYTNDELKSARLQNQRKLNALRKIPAVTQANNKVVESEPISLVWFFILFLVASGFLWLSPKL